MSAYFDPSAWQGQACASCDWWDGKRIAEAGPRATTGSHNVKGECLCPQCRNHGKQTYANNKNCDYWEAWTALID